MGDSMETTYIIEDVTVTNLDEVTTKLLDLLSKLESIEVILYDIYVYIGVILWCIGVCISFVIAYWIYKTWIRGLIRQYWKFNI